MTTPLAAVSQDIALHCDDEQGRPMAFIASFSYTDADPYAVSITFHLPHGDVPWVLSRSLLTDGLAAPSGEGDIRLWPSHDEEGCATVRMAFYSPEGLLYAAARRRELTGFLVRTWERVPVGTERSQLDLDSLVSSLLG